MISRKSSSSRPRLWRICTTHTLQVNLKKDGNTDVHSRSCCQNPTEREEVKEGEDYSYYHLPILRAGPGSKQWSVKGTPWRALATIPRVYPPFSTNCREKFRTPVSRVHSSRFLGVTGSLPIRQLAGYSRRRWAQTHLDNKALAAVAPGQWLRTQEETAS